MGHTIFLGYDVVLIVFAFFFGAAVGSAIMRLLLRRAQKRSWSKRYFTSVCCGHRLAWNDLIPILSYLYWKGKCRHCGGRIPAGCIAAEVIYGLMGVVCAVTLMPTAAPISMRLCFLVVAVIVTIVYTTMSNNIIKEREARSHG